MIIKIPEILYRGDDDRFKIRNLKTTLHFSQLQTNLLNGGQGHAIFNTPLLKLVADHVDPGWATTHFLSFSEEKKVAYRFALHCEYDEVDTLIEDYNEYYQSGPDWDFAIIGIDTRRITWKLLAAGIYEGTYQPQLLEFKMFPGIYKVILINVQEAIKHLPSLTNFIAVNANATKDKEWLLLPATEMIMNTGKIEYSGVVDGNCISEITRYKRIQ